MAELTHAQLWSAKTERLCGLYLHLSVRFTPVTLVMSFCAV